MKKNAEKKVFAFEIIGFDLVPLNCLHQEQNT